MEIGVDPALRTRRRAASIFAPCLSSLCHSTPVSFVGWALVKTAASSSSSNSSLSTASLSWPPSSFVVLGGSPYLRSFPAASQLASPCSTPIIQPPDTPTTVHLQHFHPISSSPVYHVLQCSIRKKNTPQDKQDNNDRWGVFRHRNPMVLQFSRAAGGSACTSRILLYTVGLTNVANSA